MSSPIAIPSNCRNIDDSSAFEKCSFDSSSFSTVSSSAFNRPTLTLLPTRPSFITNRLSNDHSIPTTDNQADPPLILTTLPSIRNNTLRPSRSMTSTPELSHSTATSRSSTPLLSPESMVNAPEVPCFGLNGSDDMMKRKRDLYYALPEEDQYLIYLRDDASVMSWDRIAELMREKGYSTQVKGLRTRYCTIKRDIDVSLRDAIAHLNSTQGEVDTLLGSQNCRVKRLASCGKKRMGGGLRVFEEVSEANEVDASVWSEIAAKLRASGLR